MENIEILLLPQGDEGSAFRTKNVDGQLARRVLVDRGDALVTRASLIAINHGTLTPDNEETGELGEPATLLVFEFRFLCLRQSRRFCHARVTLIFEDASGNPGNQPEVHRMCPEGAFALNKGTTTRNVKHGVHSGLTAGLGGIAGGDLGYEWAMESTHNKAHYTSLLGTRRMIDRNNMGRDNAVIWALDEDKQTHAGIPSLFRAAVLLRRVDDVPFRFTIKVHTEVDFIGTLRSLVGLERSDPVDPVEIGPGTDLKALRITSLGSSGIDLANLDIVDLKQQADVVLATELNVSG